MKQFSEKVLKKDLYDTFIRLDMAPSRLDYLMAEFFSPLMDMNLDDLNHGSALITLLEAIQNEKK